MLWTREGTYEGVHYVFDRAGNLIYQGDPDNRAANDNLELVWDTNHRLAESRKNGETTKYGYDPLGRRVFKRNPTHTTWFYWDGDALLGEVQQANDAPEAAPIWNENVADFNAALKRKNQLKGLHQKTREYVYYPGTFVPLALIDKHTPTSETNAGNDERIAAASKSRSVISAAKHTPPAAPPQPVMYYYHVDPNGCPTRLTDIEGEINWSASYEAWGGIAEQSADQMSNPLRLQGQYYDPETGLHYNRYRYYDPNIGSFVGQDPLRLLPDDNIYAYGTNPTGYIDALGLYEEYGIWGFRSHMHAGDGLDAHELLQNAWLRVNGHVKGRSAGIARQNPAIAIPCDPLHKAISRAQALAGLHDPSKLRGMSAMQNIILNSKIMHQAMLDHLVDHCGWDPKNARRFADMKTNQIR